MIVQSDNMLTANHVGHQLPEVLGPGLLGEAPGPEVCAGGVGLEATVTPLPLQLSTARPLCEYPLFLCKVRRHVCLLFANFNKAKGFNFIDAFSILVLYNKNNEESKKIRGSPNSWVITEKVPS